MPVDLKILDPLFSQIDTIFEKYRKMAAGGGAAATGTAEPKANGTSKGTHPFTSAPEPQPQPMAAVPPEASQSQPSPTLGGVPKLPFWRVAYDQGDVPPPNPKKGVPRWRDTWRWEGLLGLLKRGLKGVDPYGKAAIHGESKFPTLEEYRSMSRIVEQLIENTFNVVLVEATDAMEQMKTELKDAVKKFFTVNYVNIGQSGKVSELSGKLNDQLAIVKNLKSELEAAEARMKKHVEKRKALLLKKRMARTKKDAEQVASEIVVVDKKIDSTKGKARVISAQKKAAEGGLSSFLDGLSLQELIDLAQNTIKSRSDLDSEKVAAVQKLLSQNPQRKSKGLKQAVLDLLVQPKSTPELQPEVVPEPAPKVEPESTPEPKVVKKRGRPPKAKTEPPVEPTVVKPEEGPKDVDALLKDLF